MGFEIALFILFLIISVVVFIYLLSSDNPRKKKEKVENAPPEETPPPINKDLNPMIVIPGLGGTNLDYTIDENFNSTACDVDALNSLKEVQKSLWINPLGLLLQKQCFVNMLKPVYIKEDKTLTNLPGLKIFPNEKYVGDPTSSICLAYLFNSNKCYPLTNYSKNFVNFFTGKGYSVGYNLFIPGYDFRLVPYKNYADEYFNLLKDLIEKTFQNTGKKIHLLGHSLGTLLGNMFLNKMKDCWKKQYIKDFISISPSYDGGPKSLRTALSGYNFGLPDFIKVSNFDFTCAERNMAGLAATIPLLPEMYGAIDCEKGSISGNGEALVLLFGGKKVIYNVNNYKNGIIDLLRAVIRDVDAYMGNTESTRYLDNLVEIIESISGEKRKYAYKDPKVKVYQIIAQPVSTESGYMYDVSKAFKDEPIFTTKVIGDNDIPLYGSRIPENYGWKSVKNKIFPPTNGLDHYNAYVDSPVVYEYIMSIVN